LPSSTETSDLLTQTETRNGRACLKHSKTKSNLFTKGRQAPGARRPAAIVSIVFYLLEVLTRGRLCRSANVVSARYSKCCLSPLI